MSSTTQQLEAGRWQEYFESAVPNIEGMTVTMEVMTEEFGDQFDVERLPLQGITYDPKDDILVVSVGGRGARYPVVLQHIISSPSAIGVEESGPLSPSAVMVSDQSGVRTLIRLFQSSEGATS